jgi:ABC-2 type transport system permease protein
MFFASSALYPLWRIREGSPLLYEIARFNPFTHAVELIRFALYGEIGAKIDPTMTPVQAGISLDGVLLPLQSGELLDLTHLVVVVLCTILFLGAAVFAYNPSKGLIARRGGPGGGNAG